MTMPLPLHAFTDAQDRSMVQLRPLHAAPPRKEGRDRAMGIAITVLAHAAVLAGLLMGFHAVQPAKVETPIVVSLRQEEVRPVEEPVAKPKFAAPTVVTAPVPVIEIAAPPPPNAIQAAPPTSAPVNTVSAPIAQKATSGEGRASYFDQLLAHLNRHKRYSAAARAQKLEGVVMIHFIMDRSGRVTFREIAKSSGRATLDQAALEMMDRASPLPPMPDTVTGPTLDAVVPVNFSLRR